MFCYRPSKLFLHRSMDRAPICKTQKAKKVRKENHGESRGTRTHSFIPLLLSNLRFRGAKKEAWAQRVATLNRILNMCSEPSFVVLGTLKGWYLVILSKGKQWAFFFFFFSIDYGTHFSIRDEYYLQIVSHFFSKLQSISIQAIESLTLFRPEGLFEPPSRKSCVTSKPFNLWPP